MPFIQKSSGLYEPGAMHTYIWFCLMIGVIVFINFLEMLYIWVAFAPSKTFPFFKLRHRVSGQDRLAMLLDKLDSSGFKSEELNRNRIPEKFYDSFIVVTDSVLVRSGRIFCVPGHSKARTKSCHILRKQLIA